MDQAAGVRIAGKRQTQPRQALAVNGPIDTTQKGQVLDFLVGQRLAAQRLQISIDDANPARLLQLHIFQPAIDARLPPLLPRLLGFGGIAVQGAASLI